LEAMELELVEAMELELELIQDMELELVEATELELIQDMELELVEATELELLEAMPGTELEQATWATEELATPVEVLLVPVDATNATPVEVMEVPVDMVTAAMEVHMVDTEVDTEVDVVTVVELDVDTALQLSTDIKITTAHTRETSTTCVPQTNVLVPTSKKDLEQELTEMILMSATKFVKLLMPQRHALSRKTPHATEETLLRTSTRSDATMPRESSTIASVSSKIFPSTEVTDVLDAEVLDVLHAKPADIFYLNKFPHK
jgi:hypothetical protein